MVVVMAIATQHYLQLWARYRKANISSDGLNFRPIDLAYILYLI